MRQLRNCDFCDGQAVGTFEIVPAELEPTEAEQRRVVLCEDCQPILDELLEPLLARAKADHTATGETGSGGTNGTAVVGSSQRTGGGSTAGETTPASDGATQSGANDVEIPSSATTIRTSSAGDDGQSSAGGRATSTGSDGPQSVTGSADAERSTDNDGTNATRAGITAGSGGPPAYRKVLRLLRNRELPMALDDVETLVAGAYDMESDEVTAVLEYAVEQGELVREGSQIRLG